MKKKHKVTNWKEYNQALKQRGSLTFWLEEGFEKDWYSSSTPKKRGRPFTYSESCIKILATLRYVFKKALRQLEGFVSSLFEMAGITLKVPEFSRLSRRVGEALSKFKFPTPEEITHVVIDSSGLKVFGEKEWLEAKTGRIYQRKIWRKIHIGIDGKGNILDLQMTNHKTSDRAMFKPLLENIGLEIINEVLGDGGYDSRHAYKYLKEHHIRVLIPPPKNARVIENSEGLEERNKTIEYINEKGFHAWANKNDFGRRNRVENTFYRLKTIFGRKLKSRNWNNQGAETKLIAHLLNQMTQLGMPVTAKVS